MFRKITILHPKWPKPFFPSLQSLILSGSCCLHRLILIYIHVCSIFINNISIEGFSFNFRICCHPFILNGRVHTLYISNLSAALIVILFSSSRYLSCRNWRSLHLDPSLEVIYMNFRIHRYIYIILCT
ncbi:hypothetical protein V1511DRAFT_418074 [Dipodascopsis uninucleata]